jgi:hypothetical protein
MKKFRIQIFAYKMYGDFIIESLDGPIDIENAIIDKLGKNDIKWEKDGFTNKSKIWVTYEEVINANAHQGPLQNEERSGNRVGGTATG